LKVNSCLFALTSACIAGLWQPTCFSFEQDNLFEVSSFSLECLETGEISACQRAIHRSELLQREAASNGEYGCQSRLLGLGADLLMISFGEKRSDFALEMLEQVKMFCGDL